MLRGHYYWRAAHWHQQAPLLLVLTLALATAPLSAVCKPTMNRPELTNALQESNKALAAPNDLEQQLSRTNGRYARAVAGFLVSAPHERVWSILTDYSRYPNVFHRIKSCRVTRQDKDFIWIESELQPHLFVRRPINRTLNDLSGKPRRLEWKLLDGNFRSVRGRWELAPASAGARCQVTYILEVDPGPVIPAFLVSFLLRLVQKEVAGELKAFAERAADDPTKAQDKRSAQESRQPAS